MAVLGEARMNWLQSEAPPVSERRTRGWEWMKALRAIQYPMSNPANRLPPEYDEMQPQDYDPQFTADISTKMRVPERIGQETTGLNSQEEMYHSDLHRTANMSVPDKIVMMGQDQHSGYRDVPSDLLLDFTSFAPAYTNHVGLSTPPRVLTLDERPFPAPGDMNPDPGAPRLDDTSFLTAEDRGDKSLQMMNGYVTRTPTKNRDDDLHLQALQATPGDHLLISDEGDDDTAVMRRQIAKLSRHVLALEDENSKRTQRELVLYPVVLGYILLQVARWFLGNK